jgi:hypothetical protein
LDWLFVAYPLIGINLGSIDYDITQSFESF